MKTHKNLYGHICSFENLLRAAKKAQKGKRYQENVGRFNANLEHELIQLRRELIEKSYIPGAFRTFTIFEPKKRLISAAPYRDRVVHHALCNVIEPLFEKKFIYDSYANRVDKGTHRAILRYQKFCRKNKFVLKCDIRKYFPSIDHEILKEEIRRTIGCRDTLWLIDRIIDFSNEQERVFDYFPGDELFTPLQRQRGLPIGNLTSQFFANVYLNRFDHFVKEQLKCKFYLRYMDDFATLGNDKEHLWEVKSEMERFLVRFRIRIHENKCQIYRTEKGLSFLGFRVFPEFRLLKRENVVRTRRRIRRLQEKYAARKLSFEEVTRSVHGWLGHAKFGDTYGLRKKLFEEHPFVRTN
ncbi:RNA-dependent DNA polymerase [candidate division KSB1 bacterium]|nr:RNA-dependent DNA polymerase [candidate division KSB1 bacterium]NIS23534.1 RNA-dependent DNA polymerase [candidate division KSB1 bacterium]NIT73476.1 RNA-dependent DNA polymerase [candidate division KSB1 bacterium]NIU28776.1 RNA-dependent DNA polymerase [candidate division KSB1 bacterium]NIU93460.1 RNA-dependent DNA polymerase [candidate division KSB1 bacterium]